MGRRGWNLYVAATLMGSSACAFGVDFSDTRFRCESSADCPAGQACSAGFCGGDLPGGGAGADAGDGTAPGTADGAPPAAGTETLIFLPVADAYVDAAAPDANRGESEQLRVDSDPEVTSYVRFGRAELDDIEERYDIESAALELYAQSDQVSGYQVSVVSGPAWSEDALTFATAPATSLLVGSSGPVTTGTWTSVDLAPVMAEGDYESFALTTDDVTALSLASREAAQHSPRLVFVVAAP